jgi:hypothetical protein
MSRRRLLVRGVLLLIAIAIVPTGFGLSIRSLYAAAIAVAVGRTLWWIIFGVWLAVGAICIAKAIPGRRWVRAVAAVAYLAIMAPSLLYLGVIEATLPRMVFDVGRGRCNSVGVWLQFTELSAAGPKCPVRRCSTRS